MAQFPARTGPNQNDSAPFTSSMVDGNHPDSPRLFAKPRIGWIDNQTNVQILISPEFYQGNFPDRSRINIEPRFKDRNIGVQISQTTPVAAPFTSSMVAGYYPDRAYFFHIQPIGWQNSQTTHVSAPFSPEMYQGTPPDLPRLFIKPRIGWIDNQTTPVGAAFTNSMTDGWKPLSPILGKPKPFGWQDSQITPLNDNQEWIMRTMAQHGPFHYSLGPSFFPWDALPAPFSIDMVTGYQPSSPRIFRKPSVGWIDNQTTFLVENVEWLSRWASFQPRVFRKPSVGWQDTQITSVAAPFSFEMAQGSRPDRYRLMLGPRIDLPTSQTTFTAAPFSVEMVLGNLPIPLLGIHFLHTDQIQEHVGIYDTIVALYTSSTSILLTRVGH